MPVARQLVVKRDAFFLRTSIPEVFLLHVFGKCLHELSRDADLLLARERARYLGIRTLAVEQLDQFELLFAEAEKVRWPIGDDHMHHVAFALMMVTRDHLRT